MGMIKKICLILLVSLALAENKEESNCDFLCPVDYEKIKEKQLKAVEETEIDKLRLIIANQQLKIRRLRKEKEEVENKSSPSNTIIIVMIIYVVIGGLLVGAYFVFLRVGSSTKEYVTEVR